MHFLGYNHIFLRNDFVEKCVNIAQKGNQKGNYKGGATMLKKLLAALLAACAVLTFAACDKEDTKTPDTKPE